MVKSLKVARVNAGLTQKQVADFLNVGKSTVCRWEKNQVTPSEQICEQLRVLYDRGKGMTLKAARLNAGLTLVQVARQLNVCASTVSRWEHTKVSEDVIEQLCIIYHLKRKDVIIHEPEQQS